MVAFFVCWAPFHAQRLLTLYKKERSNSSATLEIVLFYVSGILYYVSSVINPILYSTMSAKYRTAFKRTLCRSNCCRNEPYMKSKKIQHNLVLTFRSSKPNIGANDQRRIQLVDQRSRLIAKQQLRRSSSTPTLPLFTKPNSKHKPISLTQERKNHYVSLRNNYFHNSTSFHHIQSPFKTD